MGDLEDSPQAGNRIQCWNTGGQPWFDCFGPMRKRERIGPLPSGKEGKPALGAEEHVVRGLPATWPPRGAVQSLKVRSWRTRSVQPTAASSAFSSVQQA